MAKIVPSSLEFLTKSSLQGRGGGSFNEDHGLRREAMQASVVQAVSAVISLTYGSQQCQMRQRLKNP